MAVAVARTAQEIDEARQRAQRVSFAAEDNDSSDEAAEATYQVLQWVLGDRDDDPTQELAVDEDDEGE
jgi:hypothetical protein